jgi:3-phenylpropionate/trans-cinnamate dioxygenase ferredoxin subunit
VSRNVRVCGVNDLGVGEAQRFDVEGTPICLVRVTDGFRAIGDVCSHEDYSLSAGEVDLDECEIECWKHGSMFSLETGVPTTLPATQAVPVYEVTTTGDDVAIVLA